MPLRSLLPPVFPEVSNTPLSIAIIIVVVVVVVSTCAAPLENAEDTRYFRRTRGDALFSSTVSSFCSNRRRRRRLLRLSIEAFRTWTGYMVDFPGSFACATAFCDYEFFGTIPVYRPFAKRMDRARNVLAARFCLKRKFHSRIRLMQDAQFLSDYYLSFHGETALRKGARQLLPAAKMILKVTLHSHIRRIEAPVKNSRIVVLFNTIYPLSDPLFFTPLLFLLLSNILKFVNRKTDLESRFSSRVHKCREVLALNLALIFIYSPIEESATEAALKP